MKALRILESFYRVCENRKVLLLHLLLLLTCLISPRCCLGEMDVALMNVRTSFSFIFEMVIVWGLFWFEYFIFKNLTGVGFDWVGLGFGLGLWFRFWI